MLIQQVPWKDVLATRRAVAVDVKPRGEIKRRKRGLTEREKQVIDLVQQAKTNKEIAFQLSITEGTVKQYMYHIFRKAGATNRTELAVSAFRDPVSAATGSCYGGA